MSSRTYSRRASPIQNAQCKPSKSPMPLCYSMIIVVARLVEAASAAGWAAGQAMTLERVIAVAFEETR